jgi:aquaporin Z
MMTSARVNAPHYAIEAACLALFLISAAAFTILLEHPDSPVRMSLVDPFLRRALMGLAMGLTAAALIYSPMGVRSGAHMNPAVTLAWVRVGRMRPHHAVAYVAAQFAGGLLGMAVSSVLFAPRLADDAVAWVSTRPGPSGPWAAFAAELAMTFVLLVAVLELSAQVRWQRWTGAVAATLVALFITVEAPLSGMSINPARSFGPALFAGDFTHLWIYFAAPTLGALVAAEVHQRRAPSRFPDVQSL